MNRRPMADEDRQRLTDLAEPLYLEAVTVAATMIADQNIPFHDVDEASAMNGAALALQTVLIGSPLSTEGAATALGMAMGTLLGQTPKPQMLALYERFKEQTAATMGQIMDALDPQGEA